ncbi:hypothetical protein E8E14_002722 [Neopestalotiopsis sp. 37M]|nr:hypothetical protein E8E14_002722 [Neopestalotiopsis sp. 37M]
MATIRVVSGPPSWSMFRHHPNWGRPSPYPGFTGWSLAGDEFTAPVVAPWAGDPFTGPGRPTANADYHYGEARGPVAASPSLGGLVLAMCAVPSLMLITTPSFPESLRDQRISIMAPIRSQGREQEGSPAADTGHSVLLDQDRLGDDLDYFIHLVFCQIPKRQKFDMIEKAQHRGLRIKTEILR